MPLPKVARPAGKRGIAVGSPGPFRVTIAAGLEPCLSCVCAMAAGTHRATAGRPVRPPHRRGERSELARYIESGGEDGIRTHEALLEPTPLAGERLRPLGHLSVARWIKKTRRTINKRVARTRKKLRAVIPCQRMPEAQHADDRESPAWLCPLKRRGGTILAGLHADSAADRPGETRRDAPAVKSSLPEAPKSCHLCNSDFG
jgi:hypothetical protein